MYFLYNLILRLGALLLLPVLPFWLLASSKNRRGFLKRLGFHPRPEREAFGDLPQPRIWLHAASMGEISAIAPVAAALKGMYPTASIVVSCMTWSGLEAALARIPTASRVFLLPLDFSGAVKRIVRMVEPDLMAIAETELWPNLVRQVKRSGSLLALINGRMSEKSYRRYRWLKPLLGEMLRNFDLLALQSEKDVERFAALGAKAQRLTITGNVKFDVEQPADLDDLRGQLRLHPGQPIWVAGSTRPGEEEIVLTAFERVRESFPDSLLILAPRHLERLPEVEKILAKKRLVFTLRSQASQELFQVPVLLLDTMGELSKIYSLGRVAFVGGSLMPFGGHNPLEPAILGVPVLVGPHTEHFKKTVELLVEAGGAGVVQAADDLAAAVLDCFSRPEEAQRRGRQAQKAVAEHRGASGKSAAMLHKLMLIKVWGAEVKDWRIEAASQAGPLPALTGKEYEDWPE